MNETPVDQTARASNNSAPSRSQPSRLCQACLSVLARDDLKFDKTYAHHKDLKAFVEASRMGCYICSWMFADLSERTLGGLGLLAEGKISADALARDAQAVDGVVRDRRAALDEQIRQYWTTGMRRKWDEGVSVVSFIDMKIDPRADSQKHMSISMLLNPLYEGYFCLPTTSYDRSLKDLWALVAYSMMSHCLEESLVIMTHERYLEMGFIAAELPPNTGSMATWTTVAGWVQQCSERHHCLSHVDSDWYPTRLVELRPENSFRIVRSDSEGFPSKRGYVTLSHRWGSSDFLKLTTSNLADFEIDCPVTILRKTFQDAIQVAHRMLIPYIWIDSLCIIQSGDDGADWRQESAKMAQVYSNSLCNISADWGDESNGLFLERTGSFEPPYELPIRRDAPGSFLESEVPSRPPDGGLYHIICPGGWSESVMESPLNRRGWVLQERQLAPRILHFSPKGVSWECRVKTAWERTPLGFSDEAHAQSCGMVQCAETISEMTRLRLGEPDAAVDWPKLVRDYTQCELTKQSDRLVAIAGIAKVLASTVKDQYVAGLWSKDLPRALEWETSGKKSCSLMTSYFAPSFSWAAAEGRVDHSPTYWKILGSASATFVHHREKPSPSATQSTVRVEPSGQLLTHHVFGPINTPEVEVQMQGILRSCRRFPLQTTSVDRPYGVDSYAYQSTDIEDSTTSTRSGKVTVLGIKYDRAAEEEGHLDCILYYYTIILYDSTEDHEPGSSFNWHHAGGILLKSVDSSMGRFKRIGHITCWKQDDVPFGNVLLPLGNERELPASSYDENTGQHTFYIV